LCTIFAQRGPRTGALGHDLKEISNLSGQFRFDAERLRLYKQHYLGRPEPEDDYKDELVITERDMAGAIDAVKWLDQIDSATRRVGAMAHTELVKKNYCYLNAQEFGITQTLVEAEAGVIQEATTAMTCRVQFNACGLLTP